MIRKRAVPQLLRQSVLNGDALYRVLGVAGDLVEVEVVSAPGLKSGTRLRLTQAAIATMSVVPESSWQHGRKGAAADEPAKQKLN
jgi:hypothetical protein